ncbi:MAG: prephenate/arogenate dehydrogenase [Leptolyngbyaceae cyanobacterium SM2_3_12]|nr:prephenate/arogenate dehydrogenase [Leptolyngbyaceae cyanobacterium SM2_3_12]
MSKIAIIGLGLIGGSLGLDLRQKGYTVVGIARRNETCYQALTLGAVDQAGTDLSLVQGADVVFICTPIDGVIATAKAIVPYLQTHAVITDVASVKGAIVPALTALWPHFVGGHPMAGKATAGLGVAEANLFRGKPYVLTPTEQTSASDLATVAALVEHLGADLYQCHPQAHDRAVAWISHLPVMVSSGLIQACLQEPDPEILALAQALASSGFRDTSRVGGGVPELGTLMARHNREALLQALAVYQGQLDHLTQLIQTENWDGLSLFLGQTQAARPTYVQSPLEPTDQEAG